MKWDEIKEVITDDRFILGLCVGALIGQIFARKRSCVIGSYNTAGAEYANMWKKDKSKKKVKE